ncbi:MAG: 1-phosphofructokinase [Clostridia bacterium]|nr:1-phosphofructokinase [Clostridia bacterium]MDR3644696.1 1-phosphofructokinase [Clostridia bacterium]
MLVTVTVNPALDKLYYVEKLIPGEDIRVQHPTAHAGGKGIDVAKVARLLGIEVITTGFIGGHSGNFIMEALRNKGIREAFVRVSSETRSCINVYEDNSGKPTTLLEPGEAVSDAEREKLVKKYRQVIENCSMVAMCGSVPKGIGTDFYPELISIAKAAGKTVILDTSGELLRAGIEAKPDIIKPNRTEISSLLGREVKTRDEVVEAAVSLHEKGIGTVIVSLGRDGAVFATPQGVFQGTTPDIKPVNTVGCGDSLVAGYATGILKKQTVEETILLAMAVSTANALGSEAGFFRQNELDELMPQVGVIKIS